MGSGATVGPQISSSPCSCKSNNLHRWQRRIQQMYTRRTERVHSFVADVTEKAFFFFNLSLQHYTGYVVLVYPFHIRLAKVCIQCSEENINIKDIMRVERRRDGTSIMQQTSHITSISVRLSPGPLRSKQCFTKKQNLDCIGVAL